MILPGKLRGRVEQSDVRYRSGEHLTQNLEFSEKLRLLEA